LDVAKVLAAANYFSLLMVSERTFWLNMQRLLPIWFRLSRTEKFKLHFLRQLQQAWQLLQLA
jgi:hypothetical protein